MDFGQFLGNDTLKARLSAAIDAQRSTHCYLLSGPKGSGKHTLAQLLMAAMECTADQRPCGCCSQCRKVLQGIHPDITVVDDANRKTIPVERIRQVCSDAYIRPDEGRRKIYLLPRAQDLGLPGQNALRLKSWKSRRRRSPSCCLPNADAAAADDPLPLCGAETGAAAGSAAAAGPAGTIPRLPPGGACKPPAAAAADSWPGAGPAGRPGRTPAPNADVCRSMSPKATGCSYWSCCSSWKRPSGTIFYQLLLQWRGLLVQALQAQNGVDTPLAQSREIARRRTMAEASQAIAQLGKAAEACQANAGVGHLCGMLAATLL